MNTQSAVISQPTRRPFVGKGVFLRLRGRGAFTGITFEGVVQYFRRGGFAIETLDKQVVIKYAVDSFDVESVSEASERLIRERHANS